MAGSPNADIGNTFANNAIDNARTTRSTSSSGEESVQAVTAMSYPSKGGCRSRKTWEMDMHNRRDSLYISRLWKWHADKRELKRARFGPNAKEGGVTLHFRGVDCLLVNLVLN